MDKCTHRILSYIPEVRQITAESQRASLVVFSSCLFFLKAKRSHWGVKEHILIKRFPCSYLGTPWYSHFWGFPGGSAGKESACNLGDQCSIPGLGRSPLEKGMAIHSSILAWRIPWIVHGITKSQTRLSGFDSLRSKTNVEKRLVGLGEEVDHSRAISQVRNLIA